MVYFRHPNSNEVVEGEVQGRLKDHNNSRIIYYIGWEDNEGRNHLIQVHEGRLLSKLETRMIETEEG